MTNESASIGDLALSPQLATKLIQARKDAAAKTKTCRSKPGGAIGQGLQSKERFIWLPFQGLKRLALDTNNIPLRILVQMWEIWSGPRGAVPINLNDFEVPGLSEEEKKSGVAALKKAGLLATGAA